MRKLWFLALCLPLASCMSAAQKAQQESQIHDLVAQMTPEQRGAMAKDLLENMAGLNQPAQAQAQVYYQPLPVYTPPQTQHCYPNAVGGVNCQRF